MARTPTPTLEPSATDTATSSPKRLVVEVNKRTSTDLNWLVDEEELNKTTIVNRAVQIYRMLVEAQRNGGEIVIDDPVEKTRKHIHFV